MVNNLNNQEIEVYQFLSKFFYHTFFENIDEEYWHRIRKDSSFEWFLESNNKSNKSGREFLQKSLKEDNLEDIMADFTSLFLCEEGALRSPPYASYYLDKKGEIYSEETSSVKKFYAEANYIIKNPIEPEDHIGFEIGFLYYLFEEIKNDKDNCDRYYQILKEFLESYLLPWVFSCLRLLQENATTNFYKAMGFLAEDFLLNLKERLEIQVCQRKIYNTV